MNHSKWKLWGRLTAEYLKSELWVASSNTEVDISDLIKDLTVSDIAFTMSSLKLTYVLWSYVITTKLIKWENNHK
jgi:hypothetical protein